MAGNSSESISSEMYLYIVIASTEYIIGLPINSWALTLIFSSKKAPVETEILTVNILVLEIVSGVCFILWLIQFWTQVTFALPLTNLYQGVSSLGRALFHWHVCMDRYLAVVHPIIFMRYKQIRYRGACLTALWLIVISCGVYNTFFPLSLDLVAACSLSLLVPTLSSEILCSLLIVRILRKSGPGDKQTQEKKEGNKLKRKAIGIICFLAVMVVVNNLTFILFPVFEARTQNNMFPIALALSTVGSSAHGFLFLSRAGKLRCE